MLPAADEAPRCAEFDRTLDSDPCGTALSCELIVLVEVPLPWPKPVFLHDLLAGLEGNISTPTGRARVLATIPGDPTANTVKVTTYSRTATSAAGLVHRCAPDELRELIHGFEVAPSAESRFVTDEPAPPEAVLICTQGSHDICCGSEGTRLALELTEFASIERPTLGVFRVSHTGGHRFAPTAMTLPDGRMWAHLDLARVIGILDRSLSLTGLVRNSRGWWGADSGPAQLAERAAFATIGWDWDGCERSVVASEGADRNGGTFTVTGGNASFEVDVKLSRVLPTIACRAAGGLPSKQSSEWSVTAVRRLASVV